MDKKRVKTSIVSFIGNLLLLCWGLNAIGKPIALSNEEQTATHVETGRLQLLAVFAPIATPAAKTTHVETGRLQLLASIFSAKVLNKWSQ